MSDCRKFATLDVTEKTLEERISILESKLPVLIERIQRYDKMIADNLYLTNKLDFLQKTMDQFPDQLKSLSSYLDEFKKNYENNALQVKKNVDSMQNQNTLFMANQFSLNEQFEEESSKQDSLISELVIKLNSLTQTFATNESVSRLTVALLSDMDGILPQIYNLKAGQKGQEGSLKDLTKGQRDLKSELTDLNKFVMDINTDFSSFPKAINEVRDDVTNKVNETLLRFIERCNGRLDAVVEQLAPQGVSLKEIRENFNEKLESYKLDLSNAILKSGNNTKQVSLLEKKIENIYLLLKKYNLNQL